MGSCVPPDAPPVGWEDAIDVSGDGFLLKRLLCEGSGVQCVQGVETSLRHRARAAGHDFSLRRATVVMGSPTAEHGLPWRASEVALRTMREGQRAIFWIHASLVSPPQGPILASALPPWSEGEYEWIEDSYEWEVEVLSCKVASALLSRASRLTVRGGVSIPQLGLGLYMVSPPDAYRAVSEAIKLGYRLIDTASMYQNENMVGRALRDAAVLRSEVLVVSKLNNPDHGYHEALRACEVSRTQLGLDIIDLYLIHSPHGGRVLETWDALLEARRRGWVRQIGVSNFGIGHLEQLRTAGREMPAVNQFEMSPFCQEQELRKYCDRMGVVVMGYSPLTRGERLEDHRVCAIAQKHRRSAAQVLIRWALQQGVVSIPKSVRRERLEENLDVFCFDLDQGDVAQLASCEERLHTCWDCLNLPWVG